MLELSMNRLRPARKFTWLTQLAAFIEEECTFFRVHLLAFIFIPLISSAIFFESNGKFHISFLDSLFLCYSAMTVTGLSTVNLSTLTVWQQVILYLLMAVGDITIVSWIMVLVRKNYFRNKCEYVATLQRSPQPRSPIRSRSALVGSISTPSNPHLIYNAIPSSGTPSSPKFSLTQPTTSPTPADSQPVALSSHLNSPRLRASRSRTSIHDETVLMSDANTVSSSPKAASPSLPPNPPNGVEFSMSTSITPSAYQRTRLDTIREGVPLQSRTLTILTNRELGNLKTSQNNDAKYKNLGGFPGPITLINRLLKRSFPKQYHKIKHDLTLPRTFTLSGVGTVDRHPAITSIHDRTANWLHFAGLVVGRNSDFHTEELSNEQLEEIGGVEYRALRLLSYVVPLYFVMTQALAFLIFVPWIWSSSKYNGVFDSQTRLVSKPWFGLFQVMGAYTGGGLSLVDTGMVPFQTAYAMIFALMFVILAGNHALPIFMRLIIWVGSKLVRSGSELDQTLSFLLDHPRRCFVYLFPSHQTWFLVICLLLFSMIEWVTFEVLNIGLDVYDSIPVVPRIVAGLFQGLAARASGFSIVAISAVAPAVQFLYVVMMYIAVYPVALSIRATNVYEERSLGVFEMPPDDEDEEPTDLANFSHRQRIGRYVGWHLRRQLSNDIWWLVWSVFIVAIIERDNLLDESKKWFDLFRVLFELVSAFGGIGLSLGLPSNNYSFSGAMRPLSKLVIIVVMVRGRHRGLPVAVDRAVLLPSELVTESSPGGAVKNPILEEPENGAGFSSES